MNNSLIIGTAVKVFGKLREYYMESRFCRFLQRIGRYFGSLAASSSILGFFNREWKIAGAWKRSSIFMVLLLPLKLFKYASGKLSYGTNSILEGSKILNGISVVLGSLLQMSSKVYGVLLLTFAVTEGLLSLVFERGMPASGLEGVIRLVLFLLGACMILINRPMDKLVSGSVIGGIAYDFFTLKDGINDDK